MVLPTIIELKRLSNAQADYTLAAKLVKSEWPRGDGEKGRRGEGEKG
jgi:hypothetical protein